MTNFSVTKNGVALNKNLYNWDEDTKTFSTNEYNLVIDFTGIDKVIFKTGNNCTFKTGDNCTFNTGNRCIFNTGNRCIFNTSDYCIFDTGSDCTFDAYSDCTFDTGSDCTFKTSSDCTFKTGSDCVIVRRDVIEIPENVRIKLNEHEVKGYTEVKDTKTIVIDGNEIEISNESYEELKKSLI